LTTFDYTPNYFWKLAQAHDPARLIQLELHPGLNCSRYRCAYCFGHGQSLNGGPFLTAADYENIAASLGEQEPTVIISGVATEPLTHPDPAGVISAFARRAMPVGLYTKGHAMDAAVREALVDGPGERFVTVSVDAATEDQYAKIHDIAPAKPGKPDITSLAHVVGNIKALWDLKTKHKPDLKLRASVLVFEDLAQPGALAMAVAQLEDKVDLIRVAIAQDRNDGGRLPSLPDNRRALLRALADEFANHPKVAILANSHTPTRQRHFARCIVQRTQVTLDKSGNVFPCPQVALQPYAHLKVGNVRERPLPEILTSAHRRGMFDMDIDTEMKCRICDRKDETINSAVAGHEKVFDGPSQ
jgi:radical SAM protein with 4Fe4S-binding SPASM domain